MNPWEEYSQPVAAPWEQYKQNPPAVTAKPAATSTPTNTSPRLPQTGKGDPAFNEALFLNLISKAEGHGPNTIVGGGTFSDYSSHPRKVGIVTKDGKSTAAGSYAITASTYDDYAPKIGVTDFSPESQRKIALAILKRNGALEDVRNGDFETAINKVGGIWAALPSSKYGQGKRSWEWVSKELGKPMTGGQTNTGFAPVRQDIDPASLNRDADWIKASTILYQMYEPHKPVPTNPSDLADYGKDVFGWFEGNTAYMATKAADLALNGTPEQKQAFLYMMDTYQNTNYSWEGTGRALKANLFDPLNFVGLGTLGVGTAAKFAGKKVAMNQVRSQLVESLARTGLAAGIDGAVVMGTQDAIKQSVEVTAGRKDQISVGQVGVASAIGLVGGAVVGTAADAAVAKVVSKFKGRKAPEAPQARVEPTMDNPTEPAPAAPSAPSPAQDANGFIAGPDNTRVRIGEHRKGSNILDPENDIGAITYEVRRGSNDPNPLTLVLNKDGKLVPANEVLTNNVSNGRAFIPESPEQATAIREILQRRAGTAIGSAERKAIDEELAALVKGAGTTPIPNVAGRDPNLGSTLTPDQIAAATARKQAGRLPEDNVVPNTAGAPVQLDIPGGNTGMRTTRLTDQPKAVYGDNELAADAEYVAKQIRDLPDDELTKAVEQLRTGTFSMEQQRVVARATQQLADEMDVATAEAIIAQQKLLSKTDLTPDENKALQDLTARITALENRKRSANLGDDAFGTMAGNMFRDRQAGLSGVKGFTPEGIAAEKNIPIEEARVVWADMISKAANDAKAREVTKYYDAIAYGFIEKGDFETARVIAIKKQRELNAMGEQIMPGSSSMVDKANEYAISGVFTPTTLQVNILAPAIKTFMIPGTKLVLGNPFDKAARVEAAASYNAMRTGFASALRSAIVGYKYEQALVTRDGTRLVEGELAMTGKLGGMLRIYPRLLNASDEFLSRLNYDSFVAGRAGAWAVMTGTEKNLKGKALDDYIQKNIAKALEENRAPTKADELIQPIVNKGYNLGLRGDELFNWVEKEITADPKAWFPKIDAYLKSPDPLRKGTDEEALEFVRDVLYKRPFSGDGMASKAAQWYEDGMKKFPSAKLILGQLFFRTPIRVFEEGVRLTPGLQFAAPNFMADLSGKNGTLRQVRAQAEAQSSLAIAGAVMSLYAQGRITGDEAYENNDQRKLREDSPKQPAYTIKLDDGSYWSYRQFDPVATPVKIMINGLKRLDKLRMLEAQGEDVPKEKFDQAMAYMYVGVQAIATSFRDANLLAGANALYTAGSNAMDPEKSEGAWLKWSAEKLSLLVPNTLHKIAKDNDPEIRDPRTFWQVVEEKLARPFGQDPKSIATPYGYDYFGNVRSRADTDVLWNVFASATPEERARGLSPESQQGLAELDRISKITNATFKTPYKHKMLGDLDLRTVPASDGNSTLYDVWQREYKSLEPDKILLPIITSPLPNGTRGVFGDKIAEIQQTHNDLQDAAFELMMIKEQKVIDDYVRKSIRDAQIKGGQFETLRPY